MAVKCCTDSRGPQRLNAVDGNPLTRPLEPAMRFTFAALRIISQFDLFFLDKMWYTVFVCFVVLK